MKFTSYRLVSSELTNMAKAVLLLFLMIVKSKQMAVYHKNVPDSYNSKLLQRHIPRPEAADIGISEDSEIYGSSIDDLDLADFDIVLGQRVEFHHNEVAFNKNSLNTKKPSKKFEVPNPRPKRSLVADDTLKRAEVTTTSLPLTRAIVPAIPPNNKTLLNANSTFSYSPEEVETSGDGELLNISTVEPTIPSFSAQLKDYDYINNRTDVGKNLTFIQEDDAPLEPVSCDGESCWEPSSGESDGNDRKNEKETQTAQGGLSPVDGANVASGESTQKAQTADNDLSENFNLYTKSEMAYGEINANQSIYSTETSLSDANGNAVFSDEEKEDEELDQTTKDDILTSPESIINNQDDTTLATAVNNDATEGPNEIKTEKGVFNDEGPTLPPTEPTTLKSTEAPTTDPGSKESVIEEQTQTQPTTRDPPPDETTTNEPQTSQVTEAPKQATTLKTEPPVTGSKTEEKTPPQSASTESPPDEPELTTKDSTETVTTESEATSQTTIVTSEATVETKEISDSFTPDDTISTTLYTTSALTTTTASENPTLSTSTMVLTTTSSDTTLTTTPVTVPPTPAPVLNGDCSTTDQQGDGSTQLQRCKETANAECVNDICRCVARAYQLGDTCQKRLLMDANELTVTEKTKTSISIEWQELSKSPNYDLIEYRVRWRKVGVKSDSQMRTFRGALRSRNPARFSRAVDFTSRSNFDDDQVRFTNETSVVIEKLTPGSQYVVKVAALVMMSEDARTEELWYPQASFKMNPSCLTWTPKDVTVVPQNKTAVIAFESLEGNYNKCYINLKTKDFEGEGFSEIDCFTFTVTHFVFGEEYTVETKVTAGEKEEKECESTQTLRRENKIPDPACTLDVTTVSSDSITILWEPPCCPHGYLTGYAVSLKSSEVCNLYKIVDATTTDSQVMVEADLTDVDDDIKRNLEVPMQNVKDCTTPSEVLRQPVYGQHTLTITGLRAETRYKVKVVAINDKGSGDDATEVITTLSRVPDPPSEFRGEAIGESSVSLSWKPPTRYPGVTEYVISVFQFAQGDLTNPNPSFVINLTAKGYTNDSIVVKNLRFATAYKFEIQTRTSRGESAKTQTEAIQTWERQSHPVEELKVVEVTFDTVSLTWNTPQQGNGRTRAYIILVKTTDSKCVQAVAIINDQTYQGPTQQGVSSLTEVLARSCLQKSPKIINSDAGALNTQMVLNDLKPNTEYVVIVAPYNGAGLGELEEKRAKTENAVPNSPTSFSCSGNLVRGELYISWTPPQPNPGDTNYTLTLAKADAFRGKSFNVIRSKTITGYAQKDIYEKDLLDYWQYKAFLTASTPSGDSPRVETSICRTMPAVPGKVAGMTVQYDHQNITQMEIRWECPQPYDIHGILEYFLLQIVPTKVSRSDIKQSDLPNHRIEVPPYIVENGWPDCSQPYSSKVQIIPQVTYVVKITAKVKDVKDLGSPFETRTYAPGAEPPPFPKLGRVAATSVKPRQGTFKATICPTCLLNPTFGQIIRYGLVVCQDSFCDFGSNRNHILEDYDNLVSWKTSKDAKFKIPYKIYDDSFKNFILSESHANHEAVEFTVGDQASCVSEPDTTFCNGPLPPGAQFRMFQFSCTKDGCSESDLSEVAATPAAVSTTPSDAIVIGGAASGVALALIIILIIVIVRIRLRKVVEISDNKEKTDDMQLSDITSSHDPVIAKSRPVKIKDFEENLQQLHANNNDLFSQEFTELDMDSTVHPITVGSDPQYRKLNRWSNILPYDHTRVKLKVIDGDEMCSDDYINANYLVGYRTPKDYIATQGPLTATVADFWRMVWEQESSVIVMLSAFQEKDPRSGILREKVAQYYPDEADNEGSRHDHLLVSWRGKLDNQAWEVRTFHLTHVLERRHRYVKHFFFKSWTDHKADISPQDLINFVNTVREEAESHPPGPIVVHCSAGVGRTGTFIAVDYFCRYIKDLTKGTRLSKISDVMGSLRGSWVKRKSMMWEESTVDIYGRIIALRDCRRYMVQTKSQYAFIYDTVLELIRQASRLDDTSESGNDTESCLSVPTPAAGTSATNDVLYDDVEVLKRPDNTR